MLKVKTFSKIIHRSYRKIVNNMEYVTQSPWKTCFNTPEILIRGMYMDVHKNKNDGRQIYLLKGPVRKTKSHGGHQVVKCTLASDVFQFSHLFSGTVKSLFTIIHPYFYLRQRFLRAQKVYFPPANFHFLRTSSQILSKYNSTYHDTLGAWNIQQIIPGRQG